MKPRSALFALIATAVAIPSLASGGAGCSSSSDTGGGGSGTTSGTTSSSGGGKACIAPSKDDQSTVSTALDKAKTGDTVCLTAGTFHFIGQLQIIANGVTFKGAGADTTILDFSGQISGANGLLVSGDDVTVQDLQVSDTPSDGIRANDVKNIDFENVTVGWSTPAQSTNGAYGFYPVGCDGVKVVGCHVTGASDTGVYIGQSQHILVDGCEAFGNVAGIELENSTDAEVKNNHAHDNAAGILIFNLPDLAVQGGKRANIHDNVIENNNVANFGKAGSTVSHVPAGTGAFILAADSNEFHANTVTGNDTIAAAVLDYAGLVAVLFGGTPTDPNFDPYSESNYIHDNTFSGNGTNPDPTVGAVVTVTPVPDVLWDGCFNVALTNTNDALTNCVANNDDGGTEASYYRADLCGQQGGTSQVEPTCTQPALGTQTGKH